MNIEVIHLAVFSGPSILSRLAMSLLMFSSLFPQSKTCAFGEDDTVTFVPALAPSIEICTSSPQEKIEAGAEAVIWRPSLALISKEFDSRASNTASYVSLGLAP